MKTETRALIAFTLALIVLTNIGTYLVSDKSEYYQKELLIKDSLISSKDSIIKAQKEYLTKLDTGYYFVNKNDYKLLNKIK